MYRENTMYSSSSSSTSLGAISEIDRDIGGRWSDLLPELLQLVSEKITDISDYIRFRTVCRSCRCSAASSGPTKYLMTHQIPWLMLLNVYDPHTTNCYFISLVANKVYTINLPELCSSSKVLCGTSQGWLVVLDVTESAAQVFLLNPLTRVQVQLPPATEFPNKLGLRVERCDNNNYYKVHRQGEVEEWDFYDYAHKVYINNASLSASPTSSQDCMVMAVFHLSSKFAFCRPGDKAWTLLDSKLPYHVSSVAYHNTNFFVVDKIGNTAICFSGTRTTTTATLIPSMRVPTNRIVISYLVESCGELLLMTYTPNGRGRSSWIFRLFKFDGSCGQESLKWSEVRSTNRALFFSEHNFSSPGSSYPGIATANCVYFPTHNKMIPSKKKGFKRDRSACRSREIYRFILNSNKVVKDDGFDLLLRNSQKSDLRSYWVTPTL